MSISGGEPFLHPDLIKMVNYAKSLNIRTVIFTSGVIYGKKISDEEKKQIIKIRDSQIAEIDRHEPENYFFKKALNNYYEQILNPSEIAPINRGVLKKLKEIDLDKIVFDFQAYEYETDKFIMGRKNNGMIALFNSIINASAENLNIDIHFVPMKPNYKQISDIIELLEIVKFPNISILNFVPQGRGKVYENELKLSQNELKEFFKMLDEAKKNYSGNIRIVIPLQSDNSHKCNAGLEKLNIKYDGTIIPCPAFKYLTPKEYEMYRLKQYSIYENLEEVKIPGKGKRVKALCKMIYNNI